MNEQLKIRTHNQLICSLFLYFQYTFHLASQYTNVKHITTMSKNVQYEALPSLDQNTAMLISFLRCNHFYRPLFTNASKYCLLLKEIYLFMNTNYVFLAVST